MADKCIDDKRAAQTENKGKAEVSHYYDIFEYQEEKRY